MEAACSHQCWVEFCHAPAGGRTFRRPFLWTQKRCMEAACLHQCWVEFRIAPAGGRTFQAPYCEELAGKAICAQLRSEHIAHDRGPATSHGASRAGCPATSCSASHAGCPARTNVDRSLLSASRPGCPINFRNTCLLKVLPLLVAPPVRDAPPRLAAHPVLDALPGQPTTDHRSAHSFLDAPTTPAAQPVLDALPHSCSAARVSCPATGVAALLGTSPLLDAPTSRHQKRK